MLRGFIAGIAATLVVAMIGGYLLVQSGRIPANADAKPGWLETWMAHTSLHATLRREAPTGSGPVVLNDRNLIDGIHLYAHHCAICHGTAQGTASASPIAKGLYQKPPQLATDGVEDDPPGYSFWKIQHGIRLTGMPSFRHTLTNRQIWTLALFLKHMNKPPPAAQQAWTRVTN
ncbi:MAG: c-type cytochrome [Acidiferrobacteraceae bacterium]